jgi:lactoylglutathione lyase
VPELICSDIARSRAFYCDVLGFTVRYARPHERFLYLERDGVELMLEQPFDRGRLFPRAELIQPYGRGVNFEVDVDAVDDLHAAVRSAGIELFLALEERWYERGQDAVGVRQFAVQDPDGYLLRFSQRLATRRR